MLCPRAFGLRAAVCLAALTNCVCSNICTVLHKSMLHSVYAHTNMYVYLQVVLCLIKTIISGLHSTSLVLALSRFLTACTALPACFISCLAHHCNQVLQSLPVTSMCNCKGGINNLPRRWHFLSHAPFLYKHGNQTLPFLLRRRKAPRGTNY